MVPAGAGALGLLTYLRTVAVAFSLAGLIIVITLVAIDTVQRLEETYYLRLDRDFSVLAMMRNWRNW
jgi:hypothetical protein